MGRAPCCDKANVKKGPWSPEEDSKLKSFIEHNGTGGNWITLPSKAGLKRCGKSCRLRWINYLRPDIKHGSFTEEEEKTIYRLHGQIGSRWSLIAAQLPGRTDNDIKNYWNTRLKKKLMERGSSSHYGRPHPYQLPPQLYNQLGLPDQMASAAAREGLLHGNSFNMHAASSYYQFYQQQQFLQLQQQQQQHQAIQQDPNQTVQLPTVLQHLNMRSIKSEMVDGHPPQRAPTGGVVDESERLMVIESGLRSCIVEESSGSGSVSGGRRMPVNGMSVNVHTIQNRLGNPLSPVAVATSHHNTSPASSCSNLSSDRNSFGVQIADSAFSGTGYNEYDDPASAARDPVPTMLNTSILGPQSPVSSLQNASGSGSLLSTTRYEDGVLFGEDLAVYSRSQALSEGSVEDRGIGTSLGVKEEAQAAAGGSGDWWTSLDIVSPPRSSSLPSNSLQLRSSIISPPMKWPVPTPRCGAENIYTSPQAQLVSQAHGTQPLDGLNGYNETFLSKLIS